MENTIKIPFEIKIIAGHELISDDNFYKWLDQFDRHDPKIQKFHEALELYLNGYGFIKGTHCITQDEIDTLRLIYQHYFEVTPAIKEKIKFGDLFKTSLNKDELFTVIDAPHLPRVEYLAMTDKLKTILNNVTVIYKIVPKNFYFQVINNNLYIYYSYILGSRRLCELVD